MTKRAWKRIGVAAFLALMGVMGLTRRVEPQQTVVVGGTATILRDTTFNIPDPLTTDAGKWQAHYSDTVQIYRVYCSTDSGGGTVDLNLQIRPESTPNTSGTTVLASALVCTGSGASTTAIANNTIPASITTGYIVTPMVVSTSGSPSVLRVSIITQ